MPIHGILFYPKTAVKPTKAPKGEAVARRRAFTERVNGGNLPTPCPFVWLVCFGTLHSERQNYRNFRNLL